MLPQHCQFGVPIVKSHPLRPLELNRYGDAFFAAPRLDHTRYTGTPRRTINSPGQVVCVRYKSSTNIIAAAVTMYSSGTRGYTKARYGRSAFGRLARKTKIPAMVST